jgi:hypothetical protein
MYLLICLFQPFTQGYLQKSQLISIKKILVHPDSSKELKQKTAQILVKHYIPFVFNEYKLFIRNKKNRYLLYKMNINPRELTNYAFQGFLVAAQKYNASYNIINYSKIYIRSYIYLGIRSLLPLQSMSSYEYNKHKFINYKYPLLVSHNNYWIFDKYSTLEKYNTYDKYTKYTTQEIKRIVLDTLDYEERRLFYLRYNYIDLSYRYKVKQVATYMDCNEQTVYNKLNKIYKKISVKLRI